MASALSHIRVTDSNHNLQSPTVNGSRTPLSPILSQDSPSSADPGFGRLSRVQTGSQQSQSQSQPQSQSHSRNPSTDSTRKAPQQRPGSSTNKLRRKNSSQNNITRVSSGDTNDESTEKEQNGGNNKSLQAGKKGTISPPSGLTTLDPIAAQILQRQGPAFLGKPMGADTNTTTSRQLVNGIQPERQGSLSGTTMVESRASQDVLRADSTRDQLKKGKHRTGILGRFIGNKRKESVTPDDASVSEAGEPRAEGVDARIFSEPMAGIEYTPLQHVPPAYIKMRSNNKPIKEFDHMFLAQELRGGNAINVNAKLSAQGNRRRSNSTSPGTGTIWAMEFSKDGKFLAAAGHDKILRVWAVLSSPEDRRAHEKDEEDVYMQATNKDALHLSAPVFKSKPFKEYLGHSATILDLSWSKNNFLLSSSMDKTVRLWHISREECLCTFKHNDFVPSISFHPRDDRFFLAGSLDAKLRLWSIPDKGVAYQVALPEMVTAVSFTPDGKTAIAGCLNGLCHFYETEGLKYQTQIHVRSAHGKNAKGSKITGIQTIICPPANPNGVVKMLITSNDSRIRLYNFRDKSLQMKFKGNENASSQIHATFNDDGRYVLCGSEDRKAFIWSTIPIESDKRDKHALEYFEPNSAATTVAITAPVRTRQLLSTSEDPIYDLCNPPPVTLVARAESDSSKPPTDGGSLQTTPAQDGKFARPEANSGYTSRCNHPDGNILVTADYTGRIKVFRQDCAYPKRRSDLWETGSTVSKRNRSSILGRNASVATRHSASFADQAVPSPSGSSLHTSDRILSWRQGVTMTNGNGVSYTNTSEGRVSRSNSRRQERSASPRKSMGAFSTHSLPLRHFQNQYAQNVASSPLQRASAVMSSESLTVGSSPQLSSPRAVTTPHSPAQQNSINVPPTPIVTSPSVEDNETEAEHFDSAPQSPVATSMTGEDRREREHEKHSNDAARELRHIVGAESPAPIGEGSTPAAESSAASDSNPLWLQGAQSYMFWNPASWRDVVSRPKANHSNDGDKGTSSRAHGYEDSTGHLRPTLSSTRSSSSNVLTKRLTVVSQLSSERSSANGSDRGDDEGRSVGEEDSRVGRSPVKKGDEVKCKRCGGTKFTARKRTSSKDHHLVCAKCGLAA